MIADIHNRDVLRLAAPIARIGNLADPDASVSLRSPLCGSTIEVELKLADGKVADYAHTIKACALGQASASVMAKVVVGKTAEDIRAAGVRVGAVYSCFEAGTIDSLSVIDLGEHFGRLTARDLSQLETSVPLDTLRTVIDLAVEIGRGGREGKPVGTLFVVGDAKKVLSYSHPAGFDPVRGYNRKERNLNDRRVREGIKEI